VADAGPRPGPDGSLPGNYYGYRYGYRPYGWRYRPYDQDMAADSYADGRLSENYRSYPAFRSGGWSRR
jgi:hypothetical protein